MLDVIGVEKTFNPGTVNDRAKMMVRAKADFALSIHFNGFGNESANGTEVFVPYGEKYAQIETGFKTVLAKFFKERKPFARASNFYDRNDIFDKKLNEQTKRFDAYDAQKDYFGFVRTCWESGISADLLEICFLTNPQDFKAYTEHVDEIAEGLARAIVEGFGRKFVSGGTKTEKPKPRIKTRFDVLN